jgi:hypothetical protein
MVDNLGEQHYVSPPGGGGASRTTRIAEGSSAGTDVSLRELFELLRESDTKFHTERDRRYAEVASEREKALKIKEEADKAALGLAREIQTYKDEKANELREQIASERGLYVTKSELIAAIEKLEATVKPLSNFVTSQQGGKDQKTETRQSTSAIFGYVAGGIGVLATIITWIILLASSGGGTPAG